METIEALVWAALSEYAPAVRDVTIGIEAYATPAGALVPITIVLDPDVAVWVPAAVHARVLGVCWAQGALPSIVMFPAKAV